jgi:phosphomannomutase
VGTPAPNVMPRELVARVEAWAAQDPDPETRAELLLLLQNGDEAALRDSFDHPLTFGTAGLRGALGPGPGRMNRELVRKTTAGLARFLLGNDGHAGPPALVVGHDARHRSAEFAEDTARVAAASGLRVRRFETALPTPVTAFAVRHLGAAAGVMITASHNPALDNGYKVYMGDGAQVAPPQDAAIAAAAESTPVPDEAVPSGLSENLPSGLSENLPSGLSENLPSGLSENLVVDIDEDELLGAYRRAVLAVLSPAGPRRLRSVYSPLHGVGGAVLPALFEEAGFEPPAEVAPQARPDPDFPTAPFPNPEEPGVLDLALAEAERLRADVVLVNDPDADRLAVAVPHRRGDGFRVLSGDELGMLIGDHLISTSTGADRLVATTIVSSSMLSGLARTSGVAYAETLTGFKWLVRAAALRPGHRLLFAYEEALGYAVSPAVADKDGLSAALVVADMAARARQEGRSLLDRWDELEMALGVHATTQSSVRLPGSAAADEMVELMARWRAKPPERLGALAVTRVRDLSRGEGELPPSNVLVFQLGTDGRVVLRPSGTEPKLKVYYEATTGPSSPEELAGARRVAQARLGQMRQAVAALLGVSP